MNAPISVSENRPLTDHEQASASLRIIRDMCAGGIEDPRLIHAALIPALYSDMREYRRSRGPSSSRRTLKCRADIASMKRDLVDDLISKDGIVWWLFLTHLLVLADAARVILPSGDLSSGLVSPQDLVLTVECSPFSRKEKKRFISYRSLYADAIWI